jgi:hypothetical protein
MDIWSIHIPTLAAAGLAGAAAFGSVYNVFKAFDSDQSKEQRRIVHDWLLGLAVNEQKGQQFFLELFARFFGTKHLSWKCARRSFALSATLFVAIIVIRYLHQGGTTLMLLKDLLDKNTLFELGIYLAFACIANYLSLWKTRITLTKIRFSQSGFLALAIVAGDFFATTVIFYFMYYAAAIVWQMYLDPEEPMDFLGNLQLLWSMLALGLFPIWYLTALLTSAWLWVYLIVAYGMRSINYVPFLLRFLSKVQDFNEHPVRTIGYVAAAASAAIVAVFTAI